MTQPDITAVRDYLLGLQDRICQQLETVDGKENRLEVHLFDFDQDIYHQSMSVSFVEKIREELKFDSFEVLKNQIEIDAARARAILSDN